MPSTSGFTSISRRWSPTSPTARSASARRPARMGEPRFELPLSGWYWQINRLDKPDTNASKSLFEAYLPSLESLGVAGAARRCPRGAISPAPTGGASAPSSARSISARTAAIASWSPGRPTRSMPRSRQFVEALLLTFAFLGVGLVGATMLQVRLWPAAAEADERDPRGDPRRPGREAAAGPAGRDRAAGARARRAGRFQPPDRRARADACRQSRPCPQDAALGHRQRGRRRQRRGRRRADCSIRSR